jgi:acyl carrier protein
MSAERPQVLEWDEFRAAVAAVTGFKPEDLDGEMRIVEDLAFDSLQLLELVVMLINDFEMASLATELEDRDWSGVTLHQLFDELRTELASRP